MLFQEDISSVISATITAFMGPRYQKSTENLWNTDWTEWNIELVWSSQYWPGMSHSNAMRYYILHRANGIWPKLMSWMNSITFFSGASNIKFAFIPDEGLLWIDQRANDTLSHGYFILVKRTRSRESSQSCRLNEFSSRYDDKISFCLSNAQTLYHTSRSCPNKQHNYASKGPSIIINKLEACNPFRPS